MFYAINQSGKIFLSCEKKDLIEEAIYKDKSLSLIKSDVVIEDIDRYHYKNNSFVK